MKFYLSEKIFFIKDMYGISIHREDNYFFWKVIVSKNKYMNYSVLIHLKFNKYYFSMYMFLIFYEILKTEWLSKHYYLIWKWLNKDDLLHNWQRHGVKLRLVSVMSDGYNSHPSGRVNWNIQNVSVCSSVFYRP